METVISAIAPENIPKIWNKIEPLLKEDIDKDSTITIKEIFEQIYIYRTSLLWMVWEKDNIDNIVMLLITSLLEIKQSGEPVLNMYCFGGTAKDSWFDNSYKFIEQYSIDNKCNKIRVIDGKNGLEYDDDLMDYTVSRISIDVLNIVLEDAIRLLKPSVDLSEDRYSMESVLELVYNEKYVLWFMFSNNRNKPIGAIITTIEQYPLRKMVVCLYIAGDDLEGWHKKLLETLEKHMWENDCRGLEFVGRYGWKRFLKKHGWKAPYIVCEKIFDDKKEARHVA
tara:strand:+ start:210 stop:1052 length:843 start_codon:yes stop_codon:yes gene_type:complete